MDRISLEELVFQLADQYISAAKRLEDKHPGWALEDCELLARAAIKLEKKGDKTLVTLDLSEPERVMSDLRIPLRRMERILEK